MRVSGSGEMDDGSDPKLESQWLPVIKRLRWKTKNAADRREARWDMKPENQESRGKAEGTREVFGSAKLQLVTHQEAPGRQGSQQQLSPCRLAHAGAGCGVIAWLLGS